GRSEAALARVGRIVVVGKGVDPWAGVVDPLRVGVVRRLRIVLRRVGAVRVREHSTIERRTPFVPIDVVRGLAVEVAGAPIDIRGRVAEVGGDPARARLLRGASLDLTIEGVTKRRAGVPPDRTMKPR